MTGVASRSPQRPRKRCRESENSPVLRKSVLKGAISGVCCTHQRRIDNVNGVFCTARRPRVWGSPHATTRGTANWGREPLSAPGFAADVRLRTADQGCATQLACTLEGCDRCYKTGDSIVSWVLLGSASAPVDTSRSAQRAGDDWVLPPACPGRRTTGPCFRARLDVLRWWNPPRWPTLEQRKEDVQQRPRELVMAEHQGMTPSHGTCTDAQARASFPRIVTAGARGSQAAGDAVRRPIVRWQKGLGEASEPCSVEWVAGEGVRWRMRGEFRGTRKSEGSKARPHVGWPWLIRSRPASRCYGATATPRRRRRWHLRGSIRIFAGPLNHSAWPRSSCLGHCRCQPPPREKGVEQRVTGV